MKATVSNAILIVLLIAAAGARAQTPITSIVLGPDKIGEVKTALGITTRITFPEPVQEVICGDLYDPSSGKGTFVVQRSGTDDRPGNDIFLKPVATKGLSNMFVKTGNGLHTYSFDLTIVAPAQAHRVVNITDLSVQTPTGSAQPDNHSTTGGSEKSLTGSEKPSTAEPDRPKVDPDALAQARVRADEIIRNARQQADRIVGEAETKVLEIERESARKADEETDKRFLQSLMLGIREAKIESPRTSTKTINVMLDPARIMMFDDRAYLRYVIQNTSKLDFTFMSVSLESGTGKETAPITVEITQSKSDNTLSPGESLAGVIAFDPKQIANKARLVMYVRGEAGTEIARLTIQ